MSDDEVIKILIAAGQVIAAGIGWAVISRGNDKREKRKELRAILNEIRTATGLIEAKAFEYYRTKPEDSGELAIQLKRLMKDIATLATTAARYDAKFDLSEEIAQLRIAATGGNFESAARERSLINDRRFSEIAAASVALHDKMEDQFGKRYYGLVK